MKIDPMQFLTQAERQAHDELGFCGHPDWHKVFSRIFASLVAKECARLIHQHGDEADASCERGEAVNMGQLKENGFIGA